MNNDEFFGATPELQTIQQFANARFAAVWAVFGAVLLRVAATTEPNIQLPGVIGGRASLNLLAAFVSPSGGGKGISDKVARLVWPANIVERPIGSGEGIAATFVPPKKEGVEPITRAIISVPEIDTLAGIASRQGSILLAQVKSFAMGEQLGQSNASDATTRIVAPHSYRGCMSVGAQPAHTGVLFNDTTGGTPQRFLWFLTIDPDMPGDVIADPEPLDTRLPFWTPGENGVVEISYGPTEIRETIIAAHLARQRGESEALDGHAMLTRCKVAAAMAILHKRSVVSDLDWQLSGVVMAQSDRTRDWIVAESKKADRKKVRDRALSRAAGEEFYDQRRMEQIRKSAIGMLDRDGEQSVSDLRKRFGTKEKRLMFESVLGALEAEGLVVVTPGAQRGSRVRLADSTGHPDQPGHPSFAQVNDGDQPGHPDQNAELSRPLHAVADADTVPIGTAPVTCLEWVNNHVTNLIESGIETVESGTVYAAGQAAGFKIDNLRQSVKKSDLISVTARHGSYVVWRLGAGGENTVRTAEQWLTDWLRGRDGWVKAADAYAAGAESGYGRDAVKSASTAPAVLKRGQSVATEWSMNTSTDNEQESA